MALSEFKASQASKDDEPERPTSLFAAVNDLKKPKDSEEDDAAKYNQNTLCGRIAANKKFEITTMFLITMNSLAIGYDTNYNARWDKPDNLYEGPWGFIVVENFFAFYFTFEVAVRFLGYTSKRTSLTDAWFIFDFTLVSFMVLETWILPVVGGGGMLSQFAVLRLLRLLRITRMARLMRAVPELMTIVKGMIAATRTVTCTAVLLFLVTYTWAILFTSTYHQGKVDDEDVDGDSAQAYFGSMGKSVFSLLVMGTILDDITACCDAIRRSGNDWMLFFFLCYVLVGSFTILNMLVGVLVEVVQNTASSEKEATNAARVEEEVSMVFKEMDKDKSGKISHDEFLDMIRKPNVLAALAELQVKEKHFKMYAELLFSNGTEDEGIDFEKLLLTLAQLRPGNEINSLDFRSFGIGLRYGIGERPGNQWASNYATLTDKLSTVEQLSEQIAQLPSYFAACGTKARSTEQASLTPALAPRAGEFAGIKPAPEAAKDGQLAGTSKSARQPGDREEHIQLADIANKIDVEVLERLDRTASHHIIEELQRRLGMADSPPVKLPDAAVPQAPTDLISAEAEAFVTLGVPGEVIT